MASSTAAKSSMELTYKYRRERMIKYAFAAHTYVITTKEADEVFLKPYWKDVDSFCEYMQKVNFGESTPGRNNVVLPSSLRIYTDEELDSMDAGTYVEGRETLVKSGPPNYSEFDDEEKIDSLLNAANFDVGAAPLQPADNEPLPLYTGPPPPYHAFDGVVVREVAGLHAAAAAVELNRVVSVQEMAENSKVAEPVLSSTLGARLGRKLLRMKKTLVHRLRFFTSKRMIRKAHEVHIKSSRK